MWSRRRWSERRLKRNHSTLNDTIPIRGPAACSDEPTPSGRSSEGLRGRAVELEAHERLVADDPCVVSGLDDVGVTGAEVAFCPVVVDDVHGARHDHPDVVHLAALT